MASGKVRSPVTFDFPVTDGSVPVNASYMPVECPFGSDMDVKTVPSGDFKEHSSRDPFPVQEFLFLFIAVSYTHLRAHETSLHLVCRLLLE